MALLSSCNKQAKWICGWRVQSVRTYWVGTWVTPKLIVTRWYIAAETLETFACLHCAVIVKPILIVPGLEAAMRDLVFIERYVTRALKTIFSGSDNRLKYISAQMTWQINFSMHPNFAERLVRQAIEYIRLLFADLSLLFLPGNAAKLLWSPQCWWIPPLCFIRPLQFLNFSDHRF